jgi:Ca2+-binding RTX toxin-like protein
MSFLNSDVTIVTYNPTLDDPRSLPLTAAVSAGGVEFDQDTEFFDLEGDPLLVLPADIDITASQISWAVDFPFSGHFNDASEFLGLGLHFTGVSIRGAVLVPTANALTTDSTRITFDSDSVFLNVRNLNWTPASNVLIQVSFNFNGTSAADTLTAGDGHDLLQGLGAADRLSGVAGNDTLEGGNGNDTLNGGDGNDALKGDSGNDSMTGGAGNDSYWVDSAADQVVEGSGASGGIDTVNSPFAYTLGANVENLVLLGAVNLAGTGNNLANRITGNNGANALTGKGGNDTLIGGGGDDDLFGDAGNDSMVGGAGNDRFFVDATTDKAVETVAGTAGGTDTVFSTAAYTLGAHVEVLRLQGSSGLSGTGNELANKLFGNSGANLLLGLADNDTIDGKDGADTIGGGTGNDTLAGGSGADVFLFDSANVGIDTITDFNRNQDRFDLGGGSFTGASTAPNGDTLLSHAGGTIRIQSPPALTLAQWNALVLPDGGEAGGGPMAFEAGPLHAAFLQNQIVHLAHGDWFFA